MPLAEQDPDLGLPVPRGTRGRTVTRLIAKLTWPLLRHQTRLNRAVINELHGIDARLTDIEAALHVVDDLHARVASATQVLDQHARALEDLTGALVGHEAPLNRFEAAIAHHNVLIGELQVDVERAGEVAFYRFQEETAGVRRELAEVFAEIDALRVGPVEVLRDALAEQQMRLAQFDLFFADFRRSTESTPGGSRSDGRPITASPVPPTALDGVYSALENAFAGSPAEVKDRLKGYLGDVATAAGGGGRILDLGCGRGDWLELLAEAGIPAYGVDRNANLRDQWTSSGLEVVTADVVDHLRSVEPGSLAGVTAFRLVEHLPLESVIEVLDLANAALRPGGLLVVETPNPENLVVGASTFYLDPTRTRPLPPLLLEFLVGARGFVDVEIRTELRGHVPPLSGAAPGYAASSDDLRPLLDAINSRLYGPQDYAVIARRV